MRTCYDHMSCTETQNTKSCSQLTRNDNGYSNIETFDLNGNDDLITSEPIKTHKQIL